jgi:hypothetical protein
MHPRLSSTLSQADDGCTWRPVIDNAASIAAIAARRVSDQPTESV